MNIYEQRYFSANKTVLKKYFVFAAAIRRFGGAIPGDVMSFDSAEFVLLLIAPSTNCKAYFYGFWSQGLNLESQGCLSVGKKLNSKVQNHMKITSQVEMQKYIPHVEPVFTRFYLLNV